MQTDESDEHASYVRRRRKKEERRTCAYNRKKPDG